MLSVGVRDDGRKRLGLGLGFGEEVGGRVGMEESELEEGEAFSRHKDDACIDPDIDFSYIDEKVQDVLGHFQKDFESGFSAENLGSRFGGYGSFLPSYQRSPSILSHPKTPPRAPSHNISKSPLNSSMEGTRQNPSVLTGVSFTENNNTSSLEPSETSRKISKDKLSAGESKTLKFRIKVGPDNLLSRNRAAIYSGLGLEFSPSSSPENSPDRSRGPFPDLQDALDESMTILQIMTCFSVPGGYLISPIPENLLQLTKKESTSRENCTLGMLHKGTPETFAIVADLTLPASDVKGFIKKNKKADEKNGRFVGIKNLNSKDDASVILKREIDSEAPEGQKPIADALNISLLSGSRDAAGGVDQLAVGDSIKGNTRMQDFCKESNRIFVKDMFSPDLVQVNQFDSVSVKVGGIGNLVNESGRARVKSNSKTSSEEKAVEERETSSHKEITSAKLTIHSSKIEKGSVAAKSVSVGNKGVKKSIGGSSEPQKQMFAQKATSCEKEGERNLRRKNQLSEDKRDLKESQSNPIKLVEIIKENQQAVSSVSAKEKKILPVTVRVNISENNSKASKVRKESSKDHSKESRRDANIDVRSKQVENGTLLVGPHGKQKPKTVKPEHDKGPLSVTNRLSGKKLDNLQTYGPVMDASINTRSTCNFPIPDVAAASDDSDPQNWAQCDICQKWRHLPYGTDTAHLPDIWHCSMQTWLSSLNKCHISVAVTEKAFHALYQIPAPVNDANLNVPHEVTASAMTSSGALHLDQGPENDVKCTPIVWKKKTRLKDESNIQASKSLHDVNENPSETNMLNKLSLKCTSKSNGYTTEKHKHKQKEKHNIEGGYENRDVFVEKNSTHSKSKSRRENDWDGFRSSKKMKKEGPHYPAEILQASNNNFQTKESGRKFHGDYTFSKDYGESDVHVIRSKVQEYAFTSGELEENLSAKGVEKSGKGSHSGKKRKIKEWEESHCHQESLMGSLHMEDNGVFVKEALSESKLRKQKKPKASKPVAEDSGLMNTNARVDEIHEFPPEGMLKDKGVARKEKGEQGHESLVSRHALNSIDYMKGDRTYAHPPAAATSSSSKVSSSRKNKVNFQEARASPVESVSSSPLRIISTERHSPRRDSTRKDDDVDGGSDHSGTQRIKIGFSVQQRSLEIQGNEESQVALDSLKRSFDFPNKEENHSSVGITEELMHLKCRSGPEEINVANGNGNISDHHDKYNFEYPDAQRICDQNQTKIGHHADRPSQWKSDKSSSSCFNERHKSSKYNPDKGNLKTSPFLGEQKISFTTKNGGRKNLQSDYGIQDNLDPHVPLPKEYKGFNSRVAGASCSNSNLQENHQQKPQQDDKPSGVSISGGIIGRSEMTSGSGNSLSCPPKDKHEAHSLSNSFEKVSRTELKLNVSTNGDEAKMIKQPKKSDSPIRKDDHPSTKVMYKEARDLKHTAEHLKTEGLDLESTGLFFEAVLKFLHVAFLWEPPSFDGARHGEAIRSMNLYNYTATLSTNCAHEYESCKNMAAAALAYKCVEVAYMKVAYYEHPTATKDQHELQAALQMVPPGESPSSSASDVDNLNNQGTLEKTTLAKGTTPQISGNHVIAARNRPNFMRLLKYSNDLHCAFDATRKSKIAIEAANAELGKDGIEVISSVKKVLDSSFHNVEALLPLVRLSLESINRYLKNIKHLL